MRLLFSHVAALPEGSKARSEGNPLGLIEAKPVEEIFRRVAPILHIHLGGQVIRTTAEHPFYVRDRGWLNAHELREGDQLNSHTGTWVRVDDVSDTGRVATVYNFRIAEHHTYFVGSEEWGFSVWAHNACLVWEDVKAITGLDRAASRELVNELNAMLKKGKSVEDAVAHIRSSLRSQGVTDLAKVGQVEGKFLDGLGHTKLISSLGETIPTMTLKEIEARFGAQAAADVTDHLARIAANTGKPPGKGSWYKWGVNHNGGEGNLPAYDRLGNPLTFKEYYHPKMPSDTHASAAGSSRLVVASDGTVFFTWNHYGSGGVKPAFIQVIP